MGSFNHLTKDFVVAGRDVSGYHVFSLVGSKNTYTNYMHPHTTMVIWTRLYLSSVMFVRIEISGSLGNIMSVQKFNFPMFLDQLFPFQEPNFSPFGAHQGLGMMEGCYVYVFRSISEPNTLTLMPPPPTHTHIHTPKHRNSESGYEFDLLLQIFICWETQRSCFGSCW